MRPIRLLNLLTRNARRGEFRAEGNTIYLYDVIVGSEYEAEWCGGVSPEGFIRELSGMVGEVHLRVNSPGGEVFAARAMAQAIRGYEGEVIVHVDGLAASAASFLIMAADKIVAAPGSFLMIHNAWTLAMGNADELHSTADVLAKIDGTIAESYASRGNKTVVDFAALMGAETWLTAAEALALGLVDEIDGAEAKAKNAAQWDLSAFEHAPPAQATATATASEPEPADLREAANLVRHVPEPDTTHEVAATERRVRMTDARLLQTAD